MRPVAECTECGQDVPVGSVSGGVGQPRECVHPELDGPCSGCASAESLPVPPPEVTEALGWFQEDPSRINALAVHGTRDARSGASVVRWVLSVVDAEGVDAPVSGTGEQDEHRDWVSGVGRHDPMSQPLRARWAVGLRTPVTFLWDPKADES